MNAAQGAAWWRYVDQVKAWGLANPEAAREYARKRIAKWRAINIEYAREQERLRYHRRKAARAEENPLTVCTYRSKKGNKTDRQLQERTEQTVTERAEQSFNITEEKQNAR